MLTGSGDGVPLESVGRHPISDEHVAEDARITTELANAGFAPLPCMEVHVTSELPAQRAGFMSQRTRWEHGHLSMILSNSRDC